MNEYGYEDKRLVSVITPAFNAGASIAHTIESVIKQTYPYWEMLIVDDASSDNTASIVKEYQQQDKRIRLIQLAKNQGIANARNTGMSNAKGRYIAFLDSDDIWLEQKLKKQIIFMEQHDIGFSFTQYRQFVENIDDCKGIIEIPNVIDYKTLLKGNVIGCLTVMIDRKIIPPFYMIKEKHEDFIFWLSILKQGFKAYGLQEDLARYRRSVTSVSGNKKKSAVWTWRIYRNIENLSLIESLYYFVQYCIRGFAKHYL